jgi:hypothetical protein
MGERQTPSAHAGFFLVHRGLAGQGDQHLRFARDTLRGGLAGAHRRALMAPFFWPLALATARPATGLRRR